MSYNYATERPFVFTEDGQVMFLKIRDAAKLLLEASGAVMSDKLFIGTGSAWQMMACWDRLVELGELAEVTNPLSNASLHRIFIAGRKR